MTTSIRALAEKARACTTKLALCTTTQKNEALQKIATHLEQNIDFLIEANQRDIQANPQLSKSLIDRLTLTPQRIMAMCTGIMEVIALPDPIGETIASWTRPNGLHLTQTRVPIGLIGIIYEARPNVTIDAVALCLKTGNATLLRGGSAAQHTNQALVHVVHEALATSSVPPDAVQWVTEVDRSAIDELLQLTGVLDCIIPRGGAALIDHCVQNARVPIIETGAGICHTFIDASATYEMARTIALNAKVQRPSVCNAMETLLIHEKFAAQHLIPLMQAFLEQGVQLYGDPAVCATVDVAEPATEQQYRTEYNDYILNVRVVRDISEAIDHIATYGTKHSECIVTEDPDQANRFLHEVDAAVVYHNASTRFTDGFEFGFGAEIGISTQKLHARGPMGLPALTTSKYHVVGTGHIRQ